MAKDLRISIRISNEQLAELEHLARKNLRTPPDMVCWLIHAEYLRDQASQAPQPQPLEITPALQ
jgi:hypothetical protein